VSEWSPSPSVARATRLELHPRPPYDFDLALGYLATSPSSVLEAVDLDERHYARALRLAGQPALITIEARGDVHSPRLALRVEGEAGDDPGVVAEAIAFARRVFLLDDDPAPFLDLAAGDPVLARLTERFPGLRPLLVADPYEALLFAIIGQQVNVTFARKLKRALIDAYGRPYRFGEREYLLLPEPADLAVADPADLRALQFSGQKASYVVGLSQAIAAGDLDLDALAGLPFDEAIAALTRFRGVGRWTAEYVLMRGLGARDSIPAADLGLRKIIGYAYLGRTASEEEVRTLADRWCGWRGWAAFLWWYALQLGGQDPTAVIEE
jgi:DNA-3-methyladenine glycosylase II